MLCVIAKKVLQILHDDTAVDDEFACVFILRAFSALGHLSDAVAHVPFVIEGMEHMHVEHDVEQRFHAAFHLPQNLIEHIGTQRAAACALHQLLVQNLCRVVEDVAYVGRLQPFLGVAFGLHAHHMLEVELQGARHVDVDSRWTQHHMPAFWQRLIVFLPHLLHDGLVLLHA